MVLARACIGFLAVAAASAQSILPPFDSAYQILNLGPIPSVGNYGGTAFLPSNPNVLLVAPYLGGSVRSVPLVRSPQGAITGFGASSPYATLGGTDGGLCFGPTGVLFATWYPANALRQLKPGSVTADRIDNLLPLGVPNSVGTCAFVPAGFPGAGRFKVVAWNTSTIQELPLTPDGTGTFNPGIAGAGIQLTGGPEGMVYVPLSAPLIGGKLLIAEWGAGTLAAYDLDANGDPLPATRAVVAGGAPGFGGGAVDPVTGDIVFLSGTGGLRSSSATAAPAARTRSTAPPGPARSARRAAAARAARASARRSRSARPARRSASASSPPASRPTCRTSTSPCCRAPA
ncbi:MAG: hypothetical protein FJ306_02940 [Planctomycetes bacterium]|nr:hypothetical protein [Planctomycetota bacterium]